MNLLSRMFGAGSGAAHMTCAEYKSRFMDGKEAHTLLDVRTADEFRSGYIPGAVNISLQELGGKMSRIPHNKPVVIYCRSGNRSAMAASMLKRQGYAGVHDLGGIISWVSSGYPVKRGR